MKNHPECTCTRCVSACKSNPGWCSVADAKRLIAAGYAKRLMLDWWDGDGPGGDNVYILAPASVDYEGGLAEAGSPLSFLFGYFEKGQCNFLTADDRCEIHSIKPRQCAETLACDPEFKDTNRRYMENWNTSTGRALVAEWKRLVNFQG